MKKVLILKGLPASGKSTWTKDFINKVGNYKRVNKDELRAMLDASRWSKINEKIVEKIRDLIIIESLNNNFNVVVDDTNLSPRHEKHIKELVKGIAEVEIKEFNLDVEECIKRDLQRPNSVGEKVIRRMYNESIRKKEVYSRPDLPKAIICDIDGTLTKMGNRSPYDWGKVGLDELNPPVAAVLNIFNAVGLKTIILSGRDGSCRELTEKWLKDNDIKYDFFWMREAGDMRKDVIVKKELFDLFIRNKYNIELVLDDRNCVVDMWRNDLGLNCWQIASGDF